MKLRILKFTKTSFIYTCRWVSALLVVFTHLRSILFKNFNEISTSKSLLLKIFYLVTSLGDQAVLVFFVLSGFLISRSIIDFLRNNHFKFSDYLINRISRLYSVLFLALILTFLFDRIGIHWDNLGIYQNQLKIRTLGFSVVDRTSINYFISSLFMMQNILLPPFGSNGPLWSLNYEFWYYILFPIFAIPLLEFIKFFTIRNSILYFISGFILLFILPFSIIEYFLIWLLGLIPVYFSFRFNFLKYIVPFFLLTYLCVAKIYLTHWLPFICDFITGFIFTIWLCCFENNNLEKTLKKEFNLNKFLASFSYTLYLIHLPFILCSLTVLNYFFKIGIAMEPNRISYFLFFTMLYLVYLISYWIATFSEFKTERFRLYLASVLSRFYSNRAW